MSDCCIRQANILMWAYIWRVSARHCALITCKFMYLLIYVCVRNIRSKTSCKRSNQDTLAKTFSRPVLFTQHQKCHSLIKTIYVKCVYNQMQHSMLPDTSRNCKNIIIQPHNQLTTVEMINSTWKQKKILTFSKHFYEDQDNVLFCFVLEAPQD